MFSKSYQLLPQRDFTAPRTPGLFVDTESSTQRSHHSHHRGLSFDYIPNVSQNDFNGNVMSLSSATVIVVLDLELL